MSRPCVAWIAALSFAFPMALAAQTPPEPEPDPPASTQTDSSRTLDDELETVLVTGEQPGPGLWKVSKGDHVMWILGTHGLLPKDMQWRSKHVERLVAGSQLVLHSGRTSVGPDIGFFRGLTLLPAMLRTSKNPNGAKLADVLPPETYGKWRVLKEKYLGRDDDVEQLRPTFAAERLRSAAIRKSGLVFTGDIHAVVNRAAKQHRVRIHTQPTVTRKTKVKNLRGILKNLHNMEFADAACFDRSMVRLEADIEDMRVRANAWATGDIQTLRNTGGDAGANESCMTQLMNALSSGAIGNQADARKAIEDLNGQVALARQELQQDWLEAVQDALAKNSSTFAVLPMASVGGYVTRLRELGYEVESPWPGPPSIEQR